MRWWHLGLLGLTIALIAVLVTGHLESALAGLLALLPSGRRKLEAATQRGQRDQAEAQTEAANRTRAQLSDEHARIDRETQADVDEFERHYQEREGQPPSAEEKDRWVRRFGGR